MKSNLLVAVLLLLAASAFADTALIAPSEGQLPYDTSGKVELSRVDAQDGIPLLLRATFAEAGASFGQTSPKTADWAAYRGLRFTAMNHSDKPINVTLVVRHGGSKNFGTRIDVPLTLKPGSHTQVIEFADMRNNDRSAAQLTSVRHWYIAATAACTVDFGDFTVFEEDKATKTSARFTGVDALAAGKHKAPLPTIDKPVLFHTPEADKILAAMQILPADNPWNEDISKRPVHPKSKDVIANMEPNRHLYFNADMGFIIVPPNQKKVEVKIVDYPGESDKGPYPVPDETPIEGWPLNGPKELAKIQRDGDGDRHAIIVDPVNFKLYEFFVMRRTDGGWTAAQASIFDLSTNKLRPDGWTSSDAAGLPIFPSIVRFDEVERGMVEHAMRFTARKTRRAYIYPATHFASRSNDDSLPRMGERFRLRADFDISTFPPHAQAVLKGLKKYGMILADNGVNWAISVAPDSRIKGLESLNRVKGRDFEMIVTTGPSEGPRKPDGR